jgi:hypothetical protein
MMVMMRRRRRRRRMLMMRMMMMRMMIKLTMMMVTYDVAVTVARLRLFRVCNRRGDDGESLRITAAIGQEGVCPTRNPPKGRDGDPPTLGQAPLLLLLSLRLDPPSGIIIIIIIIITLLLRRLACPGGPPIIIIIIILPRASPWPLPAAATARPRGSLPAAHFRNGRSARGGEDSSGCKGCESSACPPSFGERGGWGQGSGSASKSAFAGYERECERREGVCGGGGQEPAGGGGGGGGGE